MTTLSKLRSGGAPALAPLLGFLLLLPLFAARADETPAAPAAPAEERERSKFSLKFEPGIAFPLGQPQSTLYGVGGGAALKLLYGLGRYFDVSGNVSLVSLPTSSTAPVSGTGTAWSFGPGLRVKRPHDAESMHGMSPWFDVDALYVRTGDLNRVGFAAAIGAAFPLDHARDYWIGPFIRYQHVVASGGTNIDDRDAKLLSVGLSFEAGRSKAREVPAAPSSCPAVLPPPACPETICPAISRLPDRDSDGVPDKFDRCPDVVGPIENQGCPVYEKIIVREDKLELKEKIAFHRDTANLDPASHPLMDEVVKALKDNKGFEVSVEGYASSEGTEKHNQTLSEKRAEAVLDYLAAHGISRTRLSSRGFGETRPTKSNTTEAGREANRRVEFIVHFVILNKDGSVK